MRNLNQKTFEGNEGWMDDVREKMNPSRWKDDVCYQIWIWSSFYCSGNLKHVTNLWEKVFLERFRKERSAQQPLRRAPNSCIRHRVEKVNLDWEAHREKRISLNTWSQPIVHTHRVNRAICPWQIQVNQAVGLRQEEMQVLHAESQTNKGITLGWKRGV